MKTRIKCAAIGLMTLITMGCDQAPTKTDSMIRRDTAKTKSQVLVDKAELLTTESTFTHPSEHLDELIMIQNLLRESRQVYRDARIKDWRNPALTKLASRLKSVNNQLALESLRAVDVAIDKSIAFKQKKTDVESLPVPDNSVAKRALYTHLEKFNTELETCCLDKIMLINRFLRTEQEKYYDVIKLGHNTLYNMGLIIRDEINEDKLRKEIDEARRVIEKYDSLTASNPQQSNNDETLSSNNN